MFEANAAGHVAVAVISIDRIGRAVHAARDRDHRMRIVAAILISAHINGRPSDFHI